MPVAVPAVGAITPDNIRPLSLLLFGAVLARWAALISWQPFAKLAEAECRANSRSGNWGWS
jgi:hypothetical protein